MELPKTSESHEAGSKTGQPTSTASDAEKGQAPISGSTESDQQRQSQENEEPSFVSEEDIPQDGPDLEGQKMIEELAPATAPGRTPEGQPPRPGS